MGTVPGALAHALRAYAFVIVQAPAGFGKTTSVRAALEGEPNVAWHDAQPWEADAFAPALIDRVRTVRPDAGRLTLGLAEEGADPERLGATFAGELRHVDAPLRVVVDDAHVLGASFAGFARGLTRRMPESVRLVLLTRTPIDAGLAEAVAAGRGALVDAASLRFDAGRVRAFAASLGVPLDEAHAAALMARTEGWPIAVALALRAPASSETLLDELVARRLDALAGGDRALLEATVAFETIQPDVVAPGDAGFAAQFAALAADATLVAAVDGGFRVHPLVRESLARGIDEQAMAARHADAARAYARVARLRPALFHLARAQAPAADAAFLREHAAAAAESGLTEELRAAAARVRAAGGAPAVVALVDGLLAKARGDDGRPSFARAALSADAQHDDVLAFEARLQAIEADLARGEPVTAERIDELLVRADARGAAARTKAIVRAGWADAVAGRFARALARLDALADGGDRAVFADVAPLAAYAHHALGDFEAGERIANAAIEAWSASDDLARYAGALVWAARFALLRGDSTAAFELVREGDRVGRPFALRAHAAALQATLAEAALHVGDTALARRAARAARRSADAAWYVRDADRARTLAARILARADALEGDTAAALAGTTATDPIALADLATFAALTRPGEPADTARARAAIASAVPVDGADAVALLAAAETLDFLDALDGRDVETPLRETPFDGLVARRADSVRLAHLGIALRTPDEQQRREAFETGFALATARGHRFETHVVAKLAGSYLQVPRVPPVTDGMLEPLTAREREILVLLAAGLTNREIAQRLVLSSRTVETHVARVTGKLGVNSRARAVARAIALGVVGAPATIP